MINNKRINYLSNLSINNQSGGWSGLNHNIFNSLKTNFSDIIPYTINPPVSLQEKLISKLLRTFGLQADFYFFSDSRLEAIANLVRNIEPSDLNFFHGSTPWIKANLSTPYFCFLDINFQTYLEIYGQPEQFKPKEFSRIIAGEKKFLDNASGVFFSSRWALNRTKEQYNLQGDRFCVAGIGGNCEIPSKFSLSTSLKLLFVSLNFNDKGGKETYESFRLLKEENPNLELHIIGDTPPKSIMTSPGVCYHGILDKKIPGDKIKFENILNDTMFLIHPTRKDITPHIIIEAGYYGIPSVAPSLAGIPEMIIDNETGFLMKEISPVLIAEKLRFYLSNEKMMQKMRYNVREFMTRNFTWESVGMKIREVMLSDS